MNKNTYEINFDAVDHSKGQSFWWVVFVVFEISEIFCKFENFSKKSKSGFSEKKFKIFLSEIFNLLVEYLTK